MLIMAITAIQSQAQGKINTIEYSEAVMPAERLSNNVNSTFAERLPIISPDGQTLYFARKYHPDNIPDLKEKDPFERFKDDIYVSHRQRNGRWSPAVNVGAPLNNDTHNFVIAVSPDGRTLYLANEYGRKSKNKDGVSYSKKTPYGWSKPKALEIDNMYNASVFVGYHVSVHQRILLMAAERNDTEGDRDLYVSFKHADGTWGEPKSLGKTINTKGMEASVFLAADNKTIYFSSQGHAGYGGLDVFMSRRLDNSWTNWSKPLNLGKKINTTGNDYNYTIPASGEYAYFSSDVGSPNLMSNLYRIRLPKEIQPEPVTLVKARLVDAETGQPLAQDSNYQMVVNKDEKSDNLPEVSGYFSVREEKNVVEEIDYDGDDPEILSEITVNVQLKKKPAPYKPSPEVQALRDKLNSLQQDLAKINEERTKPIDRPDPSKRQRTDFNNLSSSSPTASKAKNKTKPQKTAKPKKPEKVKEKKEKPEKYVYKPPVQKAPEHRGPVGDDLELKKLRERYNNVNKTPSVEEIEDDPELARMKKLFGDTHYEDKKTEPTRRVEEAPIARRDAPEKNWEDEGEEIKVIKNPKKRTRPTSTSRPTPRDKSPEKELIVNEEESPKEEDELAALRRKMGQAFERDTPAKEEVAKKTKPATPARPKPRPAEKEEVEEETLALAEPANMPSFEELEAQVRDDLAQELRDEVRQKLQQEMLDEVRDDLENNLKDDIRDQLEDDMKQEVEDQLRDDLASNVQDELRDNMRDDVEQKLRDDMRKDVEDDLREKMRQDIEDELRKALRDEIEQDLRDQLADPVKEELKKEMEYRLKKEVEQKMRRELQDKMRKQERERERDIALNQQKPENTNPDPAPEYRELEEDITLYPIKVGQIIPLNNIYFDANKTSLKDESNTELERAVNFLQKNPNLIVEISGHTNGLCSHEFARELSKGRSAAVAKYVTENGVHKDRLRFKGYGKTLPIASNDTVDGRRKNQRVEMKILEIKVE